MALELKLIGRVTWADDRQNDAIAPPKVYVAPKGDGYKNKEV